MTTNKDMDKKNRKTIFLSDTHLNEVNPERQERLVSFLTKFDNLERLYIVGDLFDFWFGYKTVIFRYYLPLLCQLYRLHMQGCELIYVLGNHDFNLGPLFRETVPLRVIEAGAEEEIDGHKIFIIHGDGLDKSDRGYRLLRFVVRSPLVRWLFQWIHPDIGWNMARLLSKSSKKYTAWKKIDKIKAYFEFGRQKVSEGINYCIMAHSHVPFIKKFSFDNHEGQIINLGDWLQHFTFLQYSPKDGFSFHRYVNGDIEECDPEEYSVEL